jgi:phage shock protein PspC (stress-responsive transcriptional regulator)
VSVPNDKELANSTTTATNPHPHQDASLDGARAWFAANGLARPSKGRLLGGVTAAFARRYGANLLVMRLATIAGVLILSPLWYVALWILMPNE